MGLRFTVLASGSGGNAVTPAEADGFGVALLDAPRSAATVPNGSQRRRAAPGPHIFTPSC